MLIIDTVHTKQAQFFCFEVQFTPLNRKVVIFKNKGVWTQIFLKHIECCYFQTMTVMFIKVYIFRMEMSHRILEGGALNLFSGRGVRPGFPKCGACELIFASETRGLWAKIWVKIEAIEAKISKFSQKGVLWTDSFAWNGTLANYKRGLKRGSSGPHIPIPPF